MSNKENASKQDPDYDEVIETPESYRRINEEHCNRENTVKKIRDILERHFDGEIQSKEEEVLLIENRISEARTTLDKLRAYLLANYYGCNGKLIKGKPLRKKTKEKVTMKYTPGIASCVEKLSVSDNHAPVAISEIGKETLVETKASNQSSSSSKKNGNGCSYMNDSTCQRIEKVEDEVATVSSHRFYATKEIIVGNISKFIPFDKREKNDQATHKWMVYVRGTPNNPDVSSFLKCVWFILHPSYMPNDMIEVSKPPFTVTRRGWGEFPVRIQLIFNDSRNKPVDIIHNLKLDKTYTGLQTLGAETTVALELHRHTIEDTLGQCAFFEHPVIQEDASSSTADNDAIQEPDKFRTEATEIDCKTEDVEEIILDKKSEDLPKGFFENKFDRKRLLMSSSITSLVSTEASEPNKSIAVSQGNNDKKTKDWECSFMWEALLRNISSFPLISEDRDITKQHYCAKSLTQYRSWSFSKRRACEWQRAVDVKRFLVRSGIADTVSTKDVMLWCRKHGFTPTEVNGDVFNVSNADYCPRCGKCFPNNEQMTNGWCSRCLSANMIKDAYTLTSFEEMADNLVNQERKLEALVDGEDYHDAVNCIIDVVSCDEDQHVKEVGRQDLIDVSQLPQAKSSLELDWIYEAAAQIEVNLPSLVCNGERVPILSQVLLIAMKSFLRDLLSHSYFKAKLGKSNLEPVIVTPLHLLQALNEIPHMDFLTNAFFGIQEEDGNI